MGAVRSTTSRACIKVELPPHFGLEMLDLLGIDIDQDPHAFARFLELRNRRYCRTRPLMGSTRLSARRIRWPAR